MFFPPLNSKKSIEELYCSANETSSSQETSTPLTFLKPIAELFGVKKDVSFKGLSKRQIKQIPLEIVRLAQREDLPLSERQKAISYPLNRILTAYSKGIFPSDSDRPIRSSSGLLIKTEELTFKLLEQWEQTQKESQEPIPSFKRAKTSPKNTLEDKEPSIECSHKEHTKTWTRNQIAQDILASVSISVSDIRKFISTPHKKDFPGKVSHLPLLLEQSREREADDLYILLYYAINGSFRKMPKPDLNRGYYLLELLQKQPNKLLNFKTKIEAITTTPSLKEETLNFSQIFSNDSDLPNDPLLQIPLDLNLEETGSEDWNFST